jgi:hypothetical protein
LTTKDTLWEYLTDAAKEDGTIPEELTVKDIMDYWTLQMGFPVVSVRRDYTQGTAAFKQERFRLAPGVVSTATGATNRTRFTDNRGTDPMKKETASVGKKVWFAPKVLLARGKPFQLHQNSRHKRNIQFQCELHTTRVPMQNCMYTTENPQLQLTV